MITSTTPRGRDVRMTGNPIKILDMLVQLDGVCLPHGIACTQRQP